MKQYLPHYAFAIAVCAVATYYAIENLGPYAVVIAVFWGALLAKPLLEGAIWFYGFCRDRPLKPYQGRYYAFEGQHVRVFEIASALWLVDEDLLGLIGLQASPATRRLADEAHYRYLSQEKLWLFSESEVLRLVQDSQHENAHRLKRWVNHEIYLPYHRR